MSAPLITECVHGMGAPAACIDCMDDGPVCEPTAERVEVADSEVMDARIRSRCGRCDQRVLEGDSIVHTTAGRWIHAGCLP